MANKKPLIRNILLGVAAVLVVAAVVIQLQPAQFHLERSTVINAPAEVIFPHVNDLQLWNAWSPFAKMDPNATVAFKGPQSGIDAAMSWESDITGAGTMTVIESLPGERVDFRLDFLKPFKATSTATFTFVPEAAGGTRVTWAMDGKNDFIGKAVSLVMDCEKTMGPEFEKGLASLKEVAEAQAGGSISTQIISPNEVTPPTTITPEATDTPATETPEAAPAEETAPETPAGGAPETSTEAAPETTTETTEDVPEHTPAPEIIEDAPAEAPAAETPPAETPAQ